MWPALSVILTLPDSTMHTKTKIADIYQIFLSTTMKKSPENAQVLL